MKRWYALVAAVLCLGVAACGLFDKRASYRYRMTAEATVGGRQYSAAVVHHIQAFATRPLLSEGLAGGAAVHGEALALDLPDGPVFILLRNRARRDLLATAVTRALEQDKKWEDSFDFVRSVERLAKKSVRAELPREDWPLIIRFEDIDDPATAQLVDAAALGLTRITLETTSAPVSHHLATRLQWFDTFKGTDFWNADPKVMSAYEDSRSASGYRGGLGRDDFVFPWWSQQD